MNMEGDPEIKIKQARLGFLSWIVILAIVLFQDNPMAGIVMLFIAAPFLLRPRRIDKFIAWFRRQTPTLIPAGSQKSDNPDMSLPIGLNKILKITSGRAARLDRKKKYLQVALNSSLDEAEQIILDLPASDRILIEAGTPLIKIYGAEAVRTIRDLAPAGAYIVADNKCADLADREVKIMAEAGASAATCLGVAPIETIDSFIDACEQAGIDSMIDMMNVENALTVLKRLKKLPSVVILHRGVDETKFSQEKQIPYYQIKQIKGAYNIMVAVAGGDTIKEVERAIFNDADIVVAWKNFYQATNETAQLAASFLSEID